MGVGRARSVVHSSPTAGEIRHCTSRHFRNVGLLAPGLRRSRWQIAIPIIEGKADAAEQRQVARARRVGHHRHRRDGRKSGDAVRAVLLDRVGVGGGDDLVGFVPTDPHKPAETAPRGVGLTLAGVLDNRSPGRDRAMVLRAARHSRTKERGSSGAQDGWHYSRYQE